MWKSNRLLKVCGRIMSIVILMSFWNYPVLGEQLTAQPLNSYESEIKRYSDYEVDTLIEELTEAALEAIEQAAAEAAKAMALTMLEREAAAMREATLQQAEALRWRLEAELQLKAVKEAKRAGIKNAIIAGAVCLFGGLAVGIGGTLIIGGK